MLTIKQFLGSPIYIFLSFIPPAISIFFYAWVLFGCTTTVAGLKDIFLVSIPLSSGTVLRVGHFGVCFKDGGRDFVCATTPYKSLQTISQNLGINDPDSLSALKFARFLQSKIIIPFLVGAGPILVVGFLCFVFMKALHLHDQFLDRKGRYSNSKRGYLKYFRNVAKICLYTSVAIGVVAATSTAMAVAALTLGGQVANGPDFKAGELLVGLEIAGVSANFVFFLLALDIILEDTTVYEMTEDEFEEYTRPRERYRGR